MSFSENKPLLEPVSTAEPCGEDLRYDDDYEAIEQEINKQNSLHSTGITDWRWVAVQAQGLLEARTKDIKLACWLCYARYKVDSISGLLSGLQLLLQLSQQFWDGLYPAKVRAKAAAVKWLFPKVDTALDEWLAGSADAKQVADLANVLSDLDSFFSEKLADDAPMLLPLYRKLKNEAKRALEIKKQQEAQPKKEQKSSVISQVINTADQLLTGAVHVNSEADARKALRKIQDITRELTGYWLGQKIGNPHSYQLNRTLTWLMVRDYPQYDDNLKTGLKPVPVTRTHDYRERFRNGQYATLVPDLESSLTKSPFWLDGHYLVWQCLTALEQSPAAEEVIASVRQFLTRMPELVNLLFDDGTPFADTETQQWIAAEVMVASIAEAEENPSDTPGDHKPAWDEALEKAIALLKTSSTGVAVRELQRGVNTATSERDRYFWRMNLIRFCLQNQKIESALALLKQLDNELRIQNIPDWEPQRQLDVLRLQKQAWEKMPPKKQDAAALEQIQARMCCLDICAVLD